LIDFAKGMIVPVIVCIHVNILINVFILIHILVFVNECMFTRTQQVQVHNKIYQNSSIWRRKVELGLKLEHGGEGTKLFNVLFKNS
jgi:hypothetical protein